MTSLIIFAGGLLGTVWCVASHQSGWIIGANVLLDVGAFFYAVKAMGRR